MHDLVARTPEEKARVVRCMSSIMSYLIDNRLLYIDANGLPTHWGGFSPEYLVENATYWDDRCLWTMMLLTWMSTAYRYTGNQTYYDTMEWLVNEEGYAWSAINSACYRVVFSRDIERERELISISIYRVC